ncbi:antifungal protein ginkbilobin-like protein [Eucalyptus grandis]|uniref:antifungal protein ginkbilobin-like protein n=1 Tax=Eucalyptus grandis TaxID=71139 RepID=UPI00192E93DD|nr:antifungal protein ginkbilobin-like protein [Eucalyptus grandis]
MTFVDKVCNGARYYNRDDYAEAFHAVLQDLRSTTAEKGFDYHTHASVNRAECFGHGTCNGMPTQADCTSCMDFAYDEIRKVCPFSVGAQLQLRDCRFSYEQYSFME